jgi:hypothetical protein
MLMADSLSLCFGFIFLEVPFMYIGRFSDRKQLFSERLGRPAVAPGENTPGTQHPPIDLTPAIRGYHEHDPIT